MHGGVPKTKPCWAERAKEAGEAMWASCLLGGGSKRARVECFQPRCQATPPRARSAVEAGGSLQAHQAKGTRTYALGWEHRSRGTPLPLRGL